LAGEITFKKLVIEKPLFTSDQVGVLHLELEKVANFLSVYAYKTRATEIAQGDAKSRLQARRWLSLALQVDPDNLNAKRINEMLSRGSTSQLESDLPQPPSMFAENAVRLIHVLQARPEPAAARLAGFLALVAAEIYPQNEEAIHSAEIFASKLPDVSAAWKALAFGEMQPQ
jgi:hypothetical protein